MGSLRVWRISRNFRPWGFVLSACTSFSFRNRRLATFRSRRVRYLADSGLSGIYNHTNTATMMLGKPSTRNSNRHADIGLFDPIFVISHARLLANEVASGAAEMKRPVRKASSSRL